jgi:hypothetical protein
MIAVKNAEAPKRFTQRVAEWFAKAVLWAEVDMDSLANLIQERDALRKQNEVLTEDNARLRTRLAREVRRGDEFARRLMRARDALDGKVA